MKKYFLGLGLLSITTLFLSAQDAASLLTAKEAERIEKVLASDAMRGRRVFTPDIDRASEFIAGEFGKAGLQPGGKDGSYLQPFAMVKATLISKTGTIDGQAINATNVIAVTTEPVIRIDQESGYGKTWIKKGGSLFREAMKALDAGKNMIVWVDTAYAKNFSRLAQLNNAVFSSTKTVVFVLAASEAKTYNLEIKNNITLQKLANVVGLLPGKSKKDEYVIFSAHYDHLGTGTPENGDSIYNGANDDAAGTTAVIMLANYFRTLGNNERTIVFAAFTGEEVGGFGSQYFSKQYEPGKVMAMFNIEMIGTESKWGTNSAYITGYEKTDMGRILQKNLAGTDFRFYPDPYTDQQLFYRSDNATLARQGVPAHTISTSKMDSEPNYHKLSDQVETLDMANMAMVIKAIAISARSIVAAKDTPSRVNVSDLK